MPSTIHSRLRRPGEFVDHLEERVRVHRGAAVWVDLEVEVGRAATGVAGVADEADDLTWLDQLAVVHALGERSEEHTSELQSLMRNSYAGFCLKKTNRAKSEDRECEEDTPNVEVVRAVEA